MPDITVSVTLPALSEAQVAALRSLHDDPSSEWTENLSFCEIAACFKEGLVVINGIDTCITKLGRAALAHYDREALPAAYEALICSPLPNADEHEGQ